MTQCITKHRVLTLLFAFQLDFCTFFFQSVIHFCLNRATDSSFQVYLERQKSPFHSTYYGVMLLFFSLNLILLHELLGMKDQEVGPVVNFTCPPGFCPEVKLLIFAVLNREADDKYELIQEESYSHIKAEGKRIGTQ